MVWRGLEGVAADLAAGVLTEDAFVAIGAIEGGLGREERMVARADDPLMGQFGAGRQCGVLAGVAEHQNIFT